jgi:signal transduction histidine kinase
MTTLARGLLGTTLLSLFMTFAAAEAPKRVLILHSFGPTFGDQYAEEMRAELDRQMPGRLELYEDWLASARFTNPQEDAAFENYLRTLFADRPLDLILTLGAPAATFVERYRQSLFPSTPEVLADVEERRLSIAGVAVNDVAVAISVSFPEIVQNILWILPRTTTLAVVIGNSALERYWVDQIRDTLQPFANRLSLTFLNDMPFDQVLKRVATLPPRSAIFYVELSAEVDGIPQDEDDALAQLHAVANAPMFSYTDAYLGKGIAGGPLISREELSRKTVSLAVRILNGEHASDLRIPPIRFAKPQYDWRELKRWKVKESDLPPGSSVRFYEPSAWERYHWQIVSAVALIMLETALIAGLLYEHGRRRKAEIEAAGRMAELAHMNRRSTLGELSASIAHELSQPLLAILANAEAAGDNLTRLRAKLSGFGNGLTGRDQLNKRSVEIPSLRQRLDALDLTEINDILTHIQRDAARASEVIHRLRGLLSKTISKAKVFELNEAVRQVFDLLSDQASSQRITLSTSFAPQEPRVRADPVQIQQVILNLVMNGMEALQSVRSGERRIIGRTYLLDDATVEVAIENTGPRISTDNLKQVFEPFFTTKESGMGMGLSISRTIVESQGGRIWAENRQGGGVAFRFTLPVARGSLIIEEPFAKTHDSTSVKLP